MSLGGGKLTMGESRGGSLLWVSLGGELTMGESRGREAYYG